MVSFLIINVFTKYSTEKNCVTFFFYPKDVYHVCKPYCSFKSTFTPSPTLCDAYNLVYLLRSLYHILTSFLNFAI